MYCHCTLVQAESLRITDIQGVIITKKPFSFYTPVAIWVNGVLLSCLCVLVFVLPSVTFEDKIAFEQMELPP